MTFAREISRKFHPQLDNLFVLIMTSQNQNLLPLLSLQHPRLHLQHAPHMLPWTKIFLRKYSIRLHERKRVPRVRAIFGYVLIARLRTTIVAEIASFACSLWSEYGNGRIMCGKHRDPRRCITPEKSIRKMIGVVMPPRCIGIDYGTLSLHTHSARGRR